MEGFYPEIPLQHTSSFCKTFSILSRCVCMNVSSYKTWEILLLRLNKPVILHSVEFEISTCTLLKPLDLKIFLGGGGGMPPDPLEPRTFGARI